MDIEQEIPEPGTPEINPGHMVSLPESSIKFEPEPSPDELPVRDPPKRAKNRQTKPPPREHREPTLAFEAAFGTITNNLKKKRK